MGKSNKNEHSFESQWQDAFRNENIAVSPHVWTQIEGKLNRDAIVMYKQKATYYKWAAVVALLIATSVFIYDASLDLNNPNTLADTATSKDTPAMAEIESNVEDKGSLSHEKPAPKEKVIAKTHTSSGTPPASKNYTKQLAFSSMTDSLTETISLAESALASQNIDSTLMPREKIKPVIAGLSKPVYLPQPPSPIYIFRNQPGQRNQSHKSEKYWASVGVGSSTFNPNYNSGPAMASTPLLARTQDSFISSNSFNVANSQENWRENMSSGIQYQAGIHMGMRLTERLTIEGGLNYSDVYVNGETNLTIDNRYFANAIPITSESTSVRALNDYAVSGELMRYTEEDVSLSNNFGFAGIPVKAGYIILDQKFNLRLTAGLMANIYMGNTVSDRNEQYASIRLSPGADSPYRNVSFSGLTGISMGYHLTDQLDLIMEPHYQTALQTLTKAETNFTATPSMLGINAGVRYKFR